MTIANVLLRKLRNLGHHSSFIKIWLLPTWLLLGISRALILAISFKRLAPRLGIHEGAAPWVPLLDGFEETRAEEIGRLVSVTARYTPWESNCFSQAVTGRLLLGLYRIPYVLYFGLARDASGDEMKAHAWLVAGRVKVTGGYSFGQFTVVGCFVAPQLARSRPKSP